MTAQPAPAPAPLLDVRDLSAAYGPAPVLHGLRLQMASGSVTALLGANGAGKTTTLRALCSMSVRTRGEVRLDGERIDGRSTEEVARLGVAHVPEGRGTFLGLSTEENLRLGAWTRRDRHAVAADLDRVYRHFPRLRERRRQQAGTLSGGEQQMLAVSRALMSRPRLLLLDEPSFGLAPRIVHELYAILRRINEHEGVSILLVEQNASLALGIADHAYLLETGRIVLGGRAEELRRDATVRRAYLGEP